MRNSLPTYNPNDEFFTGLHHPHQQRVVHDEVQWQEQCVLRDGLVQHRLRMGSDIQWSIHVHYKRKPHIDINYKLDAALDLGAISLKVRSAFLGTKYTSLPPKRFSETTPCILLIGTTEIE